MDHYTEFVHLRLADESLATVDKKASDPQMVCRHEYRKVSDDNGDTSSHLFE